MSGSRRGLNLGDVVLIQARYRPEGGEAVRAEANHPRALLLEPGRVEHAVILTRLDESDVVLDLVTAAPEQVDCSEEAGRPGADDDGAAVFALRLLHGIGRAGRLLESVEEAHRVSRMNAPTPSITGGALSRFEPLRPKGKYEACSPFCFGGGGGNGHTRGAR